MKNSSAAAHIAIYCAICSDWFVGDSGVEVEDRGIQKTETSDEGKRMSDAVRRPTVSDAYSEGLWVLLPHCTLRCSALHYSDALSSIMLCCLLNLAKVIIPR